MSAAHVKRHKQLDEALNELVSDFFEHSGVTPSTSTVHALLMWSSEQAKCVTHPTSVSRHARLDLVEKTEPMKSKVKNEIVTYVLYNCSTKSVYNAVTNSWQPDLTKECYFTEPHEAHAKSTSIMKAAGDFSMQISIFAVKDGLAPFLT